jgi:uncharacterized protein with HEPN domain
MSRHDDQPKLRHMFDHAVEALEMTRGRNRADLDTDRPLNLALVRLLEIVGEAAARVSNETREHYPSILKAVQKLNLVRSPHNSGCQSSSQAILLIFRYCK